MSNQMRENKMGTMPVGKLIVTMSWPAVLSMLIQAHYNIVDSIFVSMISEQALAAVTYIFPVQMLLVAVGVGTGGRCGRRHRRWDQFSDFQETWRSAL